MLLENSKPYVSKDIARTALILTVITCILIPVSLILYANGLTKPALISGCFAIGCFIVSQILNVIFDWRVNAKLEEIPIPGDEEKKFKLLYTYNLPTFYKPVIYEIHTVDELIKKNNKFIVYGHVSYGSPVGRTAMIVQKKCTIYVNDETVNYVNDEINKLQAQYMEGKICF